MTDRLDHVRCVLDALQCGAAVIDRAGRFVHVNPRLAALCDRPLDRLVGTSLWDLYTDPDARRRIDRAMAAFDDPHEYEFHVPRPDGTRIPVVVASRPLATTHGDPPTHRVVTVIDISPQRDAIDQLTAMSDTVLEQALELKRFNKMLGRLVDERTRELHDANLDSIYMLAVASEARDESTGEHVRRIQKLARRLARAAGLPDEDADRIGYSAILHDVGKLHVPDAILKKPGALTDDERRVMQRHTLDGESMLSVRPFFDTARHIARAHHENHDGSGYPDGLAADAIPLPARIVHIVDVFDALMHQRVYKPAWPVELAADKIREGAGTMFDPGLVKVFDGVYRTGELVEA